MKHIAILLTVAVLGIAAFAGDAWDEYGDPSEMKGLTKVYVDTGEYLEVRKIVIEELKKALPDVTVTPGAEGVELALVFVPRIIKGDDTETTLYVLRPVEGKIRLLDRYQDWSTHTGTTGFARTSRVLVKKFVTAYRSANKG